MPSGNIKFIILLYHKIGVPPEGAKFPGLYVKEEEFDRQIKYLTKKGYAFLTLSELKKVYDAHYNYGYKYNLDNRAELQGRLLSGSGQINEPVFKKNRYAAITFDDGSRSVYIKGLKIMKENRVKATVFMVSGLAGSINDWDIKNGETPDEMLTLGELKETMENGIEIGAHTMTHPHLTQIPLEAAFNEISGSKKALEDMLGSRINFFAYPYGDYNEGIRSCVEKAGFMGACITRTGIVKKGSDFFTLKRVAIRHNTDFFKFKRKIFKVRHFY